MVRKMRDHCKQLMGQFAAGSETTGYEAMCQEMHDRCGQMAQQHEEPSEPVATA